MPLLRTTGCTTGRSVRGCKRGCTSALRAPSSARVAVIAPAAADGWSETRGRRLEASATARSNAMREHVATARWRLRATDPDLAARYRAAGLWDDTGVGDLLWRGLATAADEPFVVHSALRPFRGRFADVHDLARRVAAGMRARGVGPGDLVAFQLPNWVEAAATFYATAMLGAVVVPIVHIYGARELSHILGETQVRLVVVADRFRHLDYLAILEELRPSLPALETVAVVGETCPSWAIPFAALADGAALDEPARVDPDAPALVAYTSGTTAVPKGVVHTHRSLVAEVRQMAATQPDDSPPALTGAPVGHAIGMLGALLLPVYRGTPIHLVDVWDPGRVLEIMLAEGVSGGNGATYFLQSLLDHPACDARHRALLRRVGLGGAPVPPAIGERCEQLGISLVRFYGSTEHPSTTGSTHDEPRRVRLLTDGRPLAGVELRIVDDAGRDVGVGTPGEVLSRGPDLFAGYTDWRLTAGAVDEAGWYRTGDIGVLDDGGCLTITDRKSDVIIRGGENISATEVEELLVRHPSVAEVAVVAAPDARLGERAVAVLRLRPSAEPPTVEDLRRYLEGCGLARQKCPEEVRVVDDFPRTASGKVQKYVLRDRLREGRL